MAIRVRKEGGNEGKERMDGMQAVLARPFSFVNPDAHTGMVNRDSRNLAFPFSHMSVETPSSAMS